MKRALLLILICAAALPLGAQSLGAQSLDAFREQLAVPAVTGITLGASRVVATEYGDAADAVDRLTSTPPRPRLRGYRVCIFFDNGQDARTGAVAAKTLFEETYPDIPVYMVYENPYFRVTVGNCLTAEEAIILRGRVAATFEKAFPKSEEFSVSDLLNEK